MAKKEFTEKELKIFKEEKGKKIKNPFNEIFNEHFPKQVIFIALVVILVIFIVFHLNDIAIFIKKLVNILMPIIIGWILTYLLSPLYNLIVKKITIKNQSKRNTRFAKIIATISCAIIVLLVGVGVVYLFVPQLYISISNFVTKVPGYYDNIVSALKTYHENANDQFSKKAFEDMSALLASFMNTTSDIHNFNISKIFENIYNGFYFSLRMILNIFVGLIVMMYSLNLKDEIVNGLKRILFAIARKDIAQKILVEIRYANKVFSGFLVGKILDSLIIGVLCYVGCFIMKIPYTPLIAVIVGITNIIPFFGPFIGAIPSFAIILLDAPLTWKPWVFLLFVLALQQLDGNVIGPKILGDKTGVGSFWVLFSILLFGGLFGFIGMIIAVPLWAIITKLFEEFIVVKLKEKGYPLTTEDYHKLKEYNETLNNTKE